MSTADSAQAPLPSVPDFIDTAICQCGLVTFDADSAPAWRCVGNRTIDILHGLSGKWFNALNSPPLAIEAQGLSIDDAQYPPDLSQSFLAQNSSTAQVQLVPAETVNPNPLSIFDNSCTGINSTRMSEKWYTYQRQINQTGKTQWNLCWNPQLQPIPMQNGIDFFQNGCDKGFICPNNTLNAPPVYCPPNPLCGIKRLSGGTCTVAQGDFEPLQCQPGYYCPPTLGNVTLQSRDTPTAINATFSVNTSDVGNVHQYPGMIPCPAGSFCPPGSYEPLPCSMGAICPAGSQRQYNILPVILSVGFDIMLITLLLLAGLKGYLATSRRGPKGKSGRSTPATTTLLERTKTFVYDVREHSLGYQHLHDTELGAYPSPSPPLANGKFNPDDDFPSDIAMLRRRPTGFESYVHHQTIAELPADDDRSIYTSETKEKNELTPELQAFVSSMSRCLGGSNFGLSFHFKNLRFQPKGQANPILSDINGYISAGSLVGVLGGSGAGKSTFVNVLMGKQNHTGGEVTVNGGAWSSVLKKVIGYVPQDDIVLPELTVRENILHSARMRLPSNWTDREIQHHVDTLIDCLEIPHVANSLVGSTAKPVISGGQRKRVSIGMELAAAPMALFLDEPTSGLDATSSLSIMRTLKAISRLGITVVSIIHQPREEIFDAIDDLILLGNGRMIYQGKENKVQQHFESAGYVFPARANPADIIMDIITGQGRAYKTLGNTSKESLIEQWDQIHRATPRPDRPASTLQQSASLKAQIRKRGAPFHKQFYFCLRRAMVQQHRTISSLWFEIGVASLAGFLIGLAQNSQKGYNFHWIYSGNYVELSPALDPKSLPTMALLVAVSIGLTSAAPGTRVFGEEKLIYWREAASGHSRSAYYLGKIVSIVPRILLSCLHFTAFYLLLATPRITFAHSFAVNLLYTYCIYGLASCVSMVCRREDGPLLATMASLIVAILSGASPPLSNVKGWHVLWLWDSSPGRWLAEVYFSENVTPYTHLFRVDLAATATGFTLGRYTLDCVLLFAIGTVYRVLAYAGLVLVKRNKQR